MNYRDHDHDDQAENNPQDLLAAAGLEDSDAEDDGPEPPSNANRRRHAWSSDEEDEPLQRQGSDRGGDGEKPNDADE
nr:protein CTR9 homolog [Ipomoea batatas]